MTTMNFDDSGTLDPHTLEDLKTLQQHGSPSLLADLLGMFDLEIPTRIGAMRRAIESADLEALGNEAHRFKGGSQQLGATKLSQLCYSIETSARNHQPVDPAVIDELEREATLARNALSSVAGV